VPQGFHCPAQFAPNSGGQNSLSGKVGCKGSGANLETKVRLSRLGGDGNLSSIPEGSNPMLPVGTSYFGTSSKLAAAVKREGEVNPACLVGCSSTQLNRRDPLLSLRSVRMARLVSLIVLNACHWLDMYVRVTGPLGVGSSTND
jgi:hypothetical protein